MSLISWLPFPPCVTLARVKSFQLWRTVWLGPRIPLVKRPFPILFNTALSSSFVFILSQLVTGRKLWSLINAPLSELNVLWRRRLRKEEEHVLQAVVLLRWVGEWMDEGVNGFAIIHKNIQNGKYGIQILIALCWLTLLIDEQVWKIRSEQRYFTANINIILPSSTTPSPNLTSHFPDLNNKTSDSNHNKTWY